MVGWPCAGSRGCCKSVIAAVAAVPRRQRSAAFSLHFGSYILSAPCSVIVPGLRGGVVKALFRDKPSAVTHSQHREHHESTLALVHCECSFSNSYVWLSPPRGWEMARSVKLLSWQQEELHLIPGTPHKKPSLVAHVCHPGSETGGRDRTAGTP